MCFLKVQFSLLCCARKGGKRALIMFVDEDYNNKFDGGVSRFPLYDGLYKVLEGMIRDNIITEVITWFKSFLFSNVWKQTTS